MGTIVKWDESYSVYMKDLDNQHMKLFDIINKFYDLMATNQTNEAIVAVTAEMKKYALLHFTHEESILKKKGFPRFKSHQARHQEFVDKINDVEARLAKGQIVSTLDIAKFLRTWLLEHVKIEDKSFANYFKNNNLL